MSSRLCETLLQPLVAVVALGVVSCGGKASGEKRDMATGGASGASASGGAAGANPPAPSTVQASGNGGDIDPHATPQCLAHFQGFSAQVGGMNVDLMAFVFEPGDYEGDYLHILFLDAFRANGEHYRAQAGPSQFYGNIWLHVEQVEPRFVGSLEASLPAVDDPMRPPLMLDLAFDIAVRAGCP